MPRSGATAMRHARAVLEAHFPVVQAAGKRIVWIKRGEPCRLCGSSGVVPISQGEDLFGALDLLAVGSLRALGVQVTTQIPGRQTIRPRQRKIEQHLVIPCASLLPFPVEVWAWVDRTGFRSWRWTPAAGWRERDGLIASPLVKRPRGRPPFVNPFTEAETWGDRSEDRGSRVHDRRRVEGGGAGEGGRGGEVHDGDAGAQP